MRIHILSALAILPATVAAQNVPDLPAGVARLVKTYATAPDGQGFFEVRTLAVDLKSPTLWMRYGADDDPPIRIDRKTGEAKVVGHKGRGPNEYFRTNDLVEASDGGFGVWDTGRLQWFWVDGEGVQKGAWPLPSTNFMQGKAFRDDRGRVFIGQAPFSPPGAVPYIVRLDSARGLVDTVRVPFVTSPKWVWETRTTGAGGMTGGTKFFTQFAPSPDWGLDRKGRMFAYWSDSNFVQVQNARPARLLVPSWREPLSAADRKSVSDRLDEIEKSQRARNAEFLGPRPPVPETRAQILDVKPEINGGLIVRRSKPCAGFTAWKAPITGAAPPDSGRCGWVERFDASGKRLTPFTLTSRDQLLAVRADTAWIARRDEDDVVKILELVIPKR